MRSTQVMAKSPGTIAIVGDYDDGVRDALRQPLRAVRGDALFASIRQVRGLTA